MDPNSRPPIDNSSQPTAQSGVGDPPAIQPTPLSQDGNWQAPPQNSVGNNNTSPAPTVNDGGIQAPQPNNVNEAGVPQMPINNSWQQQNQYSAGDNPEARRKKRRMYTFIQIVSVFFLLLSSPFLIIGLINVGPQFGKDEKASASITEIREDFGAIVDKSLGGATSFSSGCQVHYSFVVDEKSYEGSAHSDKMCESELGEAVEVAYKPANPIDNTIAIDRSAYDMSLIMGGILLVASLLMIIITSMLKRNVPKPEKQQQI